MSQHNQQIVDYYTVCEEDYRRFWDLDESMAMHSGFWDETTTTLRDALRRENEVLADLVGVKPGDWVLDAGCGVGGTSFYLANRGCHVDGITLSSHQVEVANAHAENYAPEIRPHFHVMDFSSTSFPDGTFDSIWAIESLCHAPDKTPFIREAYRLLKPGGKLVVADGFATGDQSYPGMQKWLQGWALDALAPVQVFPEMLRHCHFTIERNENFTQQVLPSSRKLWWIALPMLTASKLGEWVGLRDSRQTDNIRAAYWHHVTLKKGMWQYQVIVARK